MNVAEFVTALRNTPRDWHLRPGGAIRRGGKVEEGTRQCPVFAVAGPEFNFRDSTVNAAALHLEIQQGDLWNILEAADAYGPGVRNEKVGPLRKQLLEACGLKEE